MSFPYQEVKSLANFRPKAAFSVLGLLYYSVLSFATETLSSHIHTNAHPHTRTGMIYSCIGGNDTLVR